jgi:hypothetical protein
LRFLFIFLTLIFDSAAGCSLKENHFQDSVSNSKFFSYRASIHYGALIGYKDNQPPLIFTNPYGIELAFSHLSSGKKAWQSLYNFPAVVYTLAYYNYGVPHDFGEAFSGTVSYDFNLINKTKRKLWLTAGLGLVYSTRKFNAEDNPYNKSISTDISYVLQGSVRYDIEISEHLLVSPAFSFRHFSNATLGIPNNGMNFPLLGVGVTYFPKSYKPPLKQNYLKDKDTRIHYNISSGLALKKVLQVDKRHRIYAISFYADRKLTKYNSINLGLDAFYNTSLYQEYIKHAQFKEDSQIDHRQLAITFGQELFVGKVGILTQGGLFLYQPHKFGGSFYQKYGIKYYLTRDVFLGSILKVYTGSADYMEWGVGAKF